MRHAHYLTPSNASPWKTRPLSEPDSFCGSVPFFAASLALPKRVRCVKWVLPVARSRTSDASKSLHRLGSKHTNHFEQRHPGSPSSVPTRHRSPLNPSCNHNRPPNTSCSSLPNSPVSPPGIRACRSFHSKSPIASIVLASRSMFSVICLISPNAPSVGLAIGLLAIMSA